MKIIHTELSEIHFITLSVKVSQPILACDAGIQALTVKIAFSSKTHSLHHFSRFPLFGISHQISSCNSLNIFFKLGGGGTKSCTEKLSP
jgi:hypothetical protein